MDTTQMFVSSVSGLIVFLLTFKYYFMKAKKCRSTARLDGKTVIVTGANTGIGKETAMELAKRGARVIMACRDTGKAERAAVDIMQSVPDADLIVKHLDLASMRSIRSFADDINNSSFPLHVLINNAGLGGFPNRALTEDGFEMTFGVNHLGSFLLTNMLLELLKESSPSRIVNVSGHAHLFTKLNFDDLMSENSYGPIRAYCRSKLANVMFTRELARRLQGTDVTTYSLHPGIISTEIMRNMWIWRAPVVGWFTRRLFNTFLKTPKEGCQTTVYCAVDEELASSTCSGLYYSNCALSTPSSTSMFEENTSLLWRKSEQLVSVSYDNDSESEMSD